MNNKQVSINLISNIIQFISSLIISFFFTPFIVSSVGVDAYGFYAIAGNFISYFTLLTSAINSMASKYITIEWHKRNYDKANEYFNTILYSNIFLSIIFSLIIIAIVYNLEKLIIIPVHLVFSVKILFALVLTSGIITTVGSVFTTSTFCANRLDLKSYVLIIISLLRVIILLFLFYIFKPNIFYLGISNIVCSFIELSLNIFLTDKLLDSIIINFRYFKIKMVSDLIKSGVWNSINQLNTIIINGLDILMANIFINPQIAGLLSISKTIPNLLFSLASMLGSIFNPGITISFAHSDKASIRKQFEQSFNTMGFVCSIIISGFIVFGVSFYNLWMPNENYTLLYILSILSMISIICTASTQTMGYVELLTNNLSLPVSLTTIRSFLGLIIIYLINKYTNYGIYAIAGVSSIITLVYDIAFSVPYASHCIGIEKYFFYKYKIKMIIVIIINIILYSTIKSLIRPTNWVRFFVVVLISGLVGVLINCIVYLNKNQRKIIIEKFIAIEKKIQNKLYLRIREDI